MPLAGPLLLGLDPGLRFTGWGLIQTQGSRLRHVADGVIATDGTASLPERLRALHHALAELIATYRPDEAAVEETYVNRNGAATLKLGYARAIALLAPRPGRHPGRRIRRQDREDRRGRHRRR